MWRASRGGIAYHVLAASVYAYHSAKTVAVSYDMQRPKFKAVNIHVLPHSLLLRLV